MSFSRLLSNFSIKGGKYIFVSRNNTTSPGQLYDWNIHNGWGTRTDITFDSSTGQEYADIVAHPGGEQFLVALAAGTNRLVTYSINRYGTLAQSTAVNPPDNPDCANISPNGKSVVVGYNVSPYTSAYPFTDNFGSAFSNPGTLLTTAVRSVSFSPSGNSVILTNSTSPYVHAYQWSDSSGYGTKFSDPTAVTGTPSAYTHALSTYKFADDTMVLAIATNATPYLNAYKFTDTGFVSKYSAPTALAASIHRCVTFIDNGLGAYVAAGYSISPYVGAMPFNSSTGFGTKLADPSTLITSTCYGLVNDSESQTLFAKTASAPYVSAYRFTNAWETKYSDPSSAFFSAGSISSMDIIQTR